MAAITLTATGIVFGDSSAQTTKFDSTTEHGTLIQTNTFSSTGTWTKPAGCNTIRVLLCGGGGGGSGYSESGGGGEYGEKRIDVSALATGATISVTIGGGGTGVAYSGVGNTGGVSSFGGYMSCQAGHGSGRSWSQHAGGLGGHNHQSGGGDLHCPGGGGQGHRGGHSGRGGGTFFGGAKWASHPGNSYAHWEEGGSAAPGTGGAGGHNANHRGAHGTPGICIVYSYK